jgi:N6-adenosine-specific RNA methylase IME4
MVSKHCEKTRAAYSLGLPSSIFHYFPINAFRKSQQCLQSSVFEFNRKLQTWVRFPSHASWQGTGAHLSKTQEKQRVVNTVGKTVGTPSTFAIIISASESNNLHPPRPPVSASSQRIFE